MGRIDPVVSVSGQLLAANEVRDVLQEHPLVAHAEVVARPDRRSGQAVVACVVLDEGVEGAAPAEHPLEKVASELRGHVEECLGGLSRPRAVAFLDVLPDDLTRDALRDALTVLCSARPEGEFRVTSAQVRAALEASGHESS